jgi:hypothetical protein
MVADFALAQCSPLSFIALIPTLPALSRPYYLFDLKGLLEII